MNRFLKQEWAALKPPADILLRARNRAWERLRQQPAQPASAGRRLALTAIPAAAAVALLLWPRATEPVILPVEPLDAVPHAARLQVSIPDVDRPARPAPTRPGRGIVADTRPKVPVVLPERVVVQVQLPESGVRMIWIKDSQFDLSGGLK